MYNVQMLKGIVLDYGHNPDLCSPSRGHWLRINLVSVMSATISYETELSS